MAITKYLYKKIEEIRNQNKFPILAYNKTVTNKYQYTLLLLVIVRYFHSRLIKTLRKVSHWKINLNSWSSSLQASEHFIILFALQILKQMFYLSILLMKRSVIMIYAFNIN